MTYDWAAGGHYLNSRDDYQNSYQTFRLPLPDGTEKVIERNTETSDSRVEQYGYWTSFKALYRTDNVTASNMLTVDFASNPDSFHSGAVTYAPTEYQSSHYSSSRNLDNKSFVYNGNFFFELPYNNTLTLTPSYAYTHTREASYYTEEGQDNIMNGAIDDSHQATATLSFIRPFNRWGTLQAICNGKMLNTHTRYSGSSSVEDNALTFRIGPGIRYTLSIAKVYGTAGAGFTWDHSSYGDITENMVAPWGEFSLQYAPTLKNSISFAVNYKKDPPASHYRSESVIKENPFMSYTGNPALVPFNSTSINLSYTFIPNNRYTLSVYGHAWIVSNRYGFFYEAGPEGILRTMKQPLGIYKQWSYGISATTRQFDNQFQASAQLRMSNAHSGEPYIWTKSKLTLTLSAYYYLKNFYFSGSYQSPSGWADGCMTPEWIDYHATYQLQAGWSNGKWNLNLTAKNFLTKSLYNSTGTIRTPYYDCTTLSYSSFIRSISIAATYTFPFGKKVSAENEAYQATGASTGILK